MPAPLRSRMSRHADRWLASLCTLALHLLLLVWLAAFAPLAPDDGQDSTRIPISWVVRTPLPVVSPPPAVERESVAIANTVARRAVREVSDPSLQLQASMPRGRRLNLELTDTLTDVTFQRRLSGNESVHELAASPAIRIRMQDSSLLGRLGQMTRNGICADLRKSLGNAANGASLHTIVATMREYGCHI